MACYLDARTVTAAASARRAQAARCASPGSAAAHPAAAECAPGSQLPQSPTLEEGDIGSQLRAYLFAASHIRIEFSEGMQTPIISRAMRHGHVEAATMFCMLPKFRLAGQVCCAHNCSPSGRAAPAKGCRESAGGQSWASHRHSGASVVRPAPAPASAC